MTDIPRQWLRWLARLLPQQTAHGDHAIQIGQVQGEAQVHIDRATHITHQHFYAAPTAPAPLPDSLARHVVSHNVRDEHLSERNCLVAVMLMTSLLQTVQHEAMLRLPRAA